LPRDIFVPAALDVDVRALFEGRGEALEQGLSIIDTSVPIAGLGDVDLVGIDASRRLVVIDLAGPGADAARALAHGVWFRDNLPIVRRMYQLWNVRWDAPIRVVFVSGGPIASGALAPPAGAGDTAGFALERILAVPMRTRDGREAIFLAAAPALPAAAAAPDARSREGAAPAPGHAASRSAGAVPAGPRPPAHGEIEVTSMPTPPRAAFGAGDSDFQEGGASVEGAPLRGEAYRRELGLTQDEFAEFFVGPRTAARPAQGGGDRR
jgi:hypothetical protein